jgi:Cyclic nucleotide-binding domain
MVHFVIECTLFGLLARHWNGLRMCTSVLGTHHRPRNRRAIQTPQSVCLSFVSYSRFWIIHTVTAVADSYEALPSMLQGSFVNSPRQNHVQEVGSQIMQVATSAFFFSGSLGRTTSHLTARDTPIARQNTLDTREQPHNTLIKTFAAHLDLDEGFLTRVAPYFRSSILSAGTTVYRQGDPADGLYLIESGVLRATYRFADHLDLIEESCVAGTLSGELTALAGEPRNATVVAERQAVVWKLSVQDLAKLERDHPQDAKLLIKLVLKSKFSLQTLVCFRY